MIGAFAGWLVGLAALALLMLPHEWRPLGTWDTFKVFVFALSCWHLAAWILVLVPASLWLWKDGLRLKLLHSIFVGGGAYSAAVIISQICFDRVGSDTLWFLILGFLVGASTQLTSAVLVRQTRSGTAETDEDVRV
jgi:ABC-type branched-subunit amino acid transport system permease subunit